MIMKIVLLHITLLSSLSWAGIDIKQQTLSFTQWLTKHQLQLGNCVPTEKDGNYHLCDGTTVNKKELKNLFSKSEDQLVTFLKAKKIAVEIFCKDSSLKMPFQKHCAKNQKRKSFQKISYLHGQYKPLENTILLHSSASKGSLVHEYIHYQQYQNKNRFQGKRYKYERIQLQKQLIAQMDRIIAVVSAKEKAGVSPSQLKPLLLEAVQISNLMKGFSKWQDLIDERGIFQLYINFGAQFGASDEDIALAKKNMRFICKRNDLKKIIPRTQCTFGSEIKNYNYQQALKEILNEIRETPDLKNFNRFIANVPKMAKGLSLEKKIKLLRDYIYKHWKMESDDSFLSRNKQDNILPDSTLKIRRGHCVGLTSLFLVAGEKAGMESFLVRVPEHVFPRFCQNDRCLNVETLKKGIAVDDDYYFKNGYFSKEEIEGTSYFKTLKETKHLKSSIYLSLGYIAAKANQLSLAEFLYKKSIDTSRGFAEGYSNLAGIFAAQGKKRQAKTYLKIALDINPKHLPTLVNMGIMKQHEKKYEDALSNYNVAIKTNPTYLQAYLKRASLHELQNREKKMLLDYESALIIQPRLCSIRRKILPLIRGSKKIKKYKMMLSRMTKFNRCLN